ncbi:TlpA family protein disulfide reductase [Pedobacter psychrodurus]|uniref:TlpA family protein disulfide reductase n=1 Tax=Pedobacter psychrodurus TaxID=2530456 RepID=A0A4R0Q1K0_9SPHI|nr:TlpA disulfide reductase family protein [Pedobacter psychrodurus]TCD29748.1 TlpA family protein disulfide reductase [Pedobacter psychrodurus]
MITIKKLLLATLLLFFLPKAYCQNDSIQISGQLKGLGNKSVWISFADDDGVSRSYRANASNDAFSLKVPRLQRPAIARFDVSISRGLNATNNGKTVSNPAPVLDLFVFDKGIQITGDALLVQFAKVTGDEENDILDFYKQQVKKGEMRNYEIMQMLFNGEDKTSSENAAALKTEATANNKKLVNVKKDFVKNHPNAFASVFLLTRMQNLYPAGDFISTWNSLSNKYKNHPAAERIKEYIKKISATPNGANAIDFQKVDMNGKPVRLTDFKGKTVLLDFWGSWCGPCRASNPHLKKLYEKYQSKGFEIIAIAQEQKKLLSEARTAWLKAIEEDGLTYINVLNNDGIEKQNLVRDYNIMAFPTKILISAEGKILMRITSSATDDIDHALEKIYGF